MTHFKYTFIFPEVKYPFKGIVHPKMKIPSSFTHPQVVPNLNKFLSSAEHKGWNQTVDSDYGSQWDLLGCKHFFFKNIFLCVQ